MIGTYAIHWKPGRHGGEFYDDPRKELAYWARTVPDGQEMAAVPVATLRAAAEARECGNRHLLTHDEDGKLSQPVEIQCRRIDQHEGDHHNGYCGWHPS